MGRDHLDLDGVVGDQPVAALDQLNSRLALTDAAVAHDQNALAVDLDQNAVARDARGQLAVEIGNEARNDIGRSFPAAEHGHIVLFRHFQTLRQRVNAARNDKRRDLIRHEVVENDPALLAGELFKIRRLHRSAHIEPHRLKMIEEARKIQARAAHIVYGHADLGKIGGLVQPFQMKFLYKLTQRDGIDICHRINTSRRL